MRYEDDQQAALVKLHTTRTVWPMRHCLRRVVSSALRLPRCTMLMAFSAAALSPVLFLHQALPAPLTVSLDLDISILVSNGSM